MRGIDLCSTTPDIELSALYGLLWPFLSHSVGSVGGGE